MSTMTGDPQGAHDETVSGLARVPRPRREIDFVAPLTVGQPRWQRRYVHSAIAVDAAAAASTPTFYLLWKPVIALPLVMAALSAGLLALAGRGVLRWSLHRLRRQGRAMSSVL